MRWVSRNKSVVDEANVEIRHAKSACPDINSKLVRCPRDCSRLNLCGVHAIAPASRPVSAFISGLKHTWP